MLPFKLFVDNAKTYVQLSGGALVLTITFVRDVLGVEKGTPIPTDAFLLGSWILFLTTICTGALYQYVAVKYLEAMSPVAGRSLPVIPGLRWAAKGPGYVYAIMLAAFYGGAAAFTIAAIRRLGG